MPSNPFTKAKIQAARRHLMRSDPVMRQMITRVGPFTLRPDSDRFSMLVRSIISQQISVHAARTIRQRVEQLVAPEPVSPSNLLELEVAKLRGAGLSQQKVSYILDLAQKVESEEVKLRTIGRLKDDQVIESLVRVKGIGVWTAQMFLIFSLGRLDIFPHDDLGIRSAIRKHYGLEELPNKAISHEIAAPWRPFATVASWYCWRSLE